MYSPSNLFGNISIPNYTNQRRTSQAGPSFFIPNEFDVAMQSSRDISVRQKLDQLLSSNMQQNAAIEDLKAENVVVKQQLCAVHSEMKAFRERSRQQLIRHLRARRSFLLQFL